ncbi:MAG: flavin monoamine oxidase family protein, partial [Flammeovirgaceae bacterium]
MKYQKMKRKHFLKTVSLGLASIPFVSFSKVYDKDDELFDVVIVGAGLSGLHAARTLARAGKKILVLEAQDRVGGRTWSQQVGKNDFLDLGGQWIGKGHDSMYKLVAEAGLKTFPTYTEGKNIMRINGENDTYKGDHPPLGLFALLAAQSGSNKFDRKSSKILLEKPWLSENAIEMDQQSLGSWIDENLSNKKASMLMKRMAEGELCHNLDDISLF